MKQPSPAIDLRNITYQDRSTVVLGGVDWRVERGCHWALIGPNGSGKSTLLRVVTGEVWPQQGETRVLGELFGRTCIPELRKRIGWVSNGYQWRFPASDTGLKVVLSGIDASVGLYRSFSEAEISRAQNSLDSLGCGDLASRAYGYLSQGERQRVLLARGLVHQPELLILDEPCVGLDASAVREFLSLMDRLLSASRPLTLIYVTHHLEEIPPAVGKMLLLQKGQVFARGDKDTLMTPEILGSLYGTPCRVEEQAKRYYLIWK